jgi:hypothetical protein
MILLAAGAVGYHFQQGRAEALRLIRLGDQHYREGRCLKAPEVYQQSSEVKASTPAQERIRKCGDVVDKPDKLLWPPIWCSTPAFLRVRRGIRRRSPRPAARSRPEDLWDSPLRHFPP